MVSTSSRLLGVLLSAVAAITMLDVAGAPVAAAAPVPIAPVFGAIIDDYSEYEPENTCDPVDKPGPLAVRDLLLDTYGPAAMGISRSCVPGGSSGHHEGRALDWIRDVYDPFERDQVDTFIDWLLATDQYGNRNAMLRRMGIMYLIWNREIWQAYDSTPGWEPYYGSSPHTDHLHISFSWDGAYKRTTYWNPAETQPPPPGDPICPTPPTLPAPPAVDYGAMGYIPLSPTRVLDTRSAGTGVEDRCRLGGFGRLDVQVTGVGGVPETGVGAVVLNLTGVSPDSPTYLGAYPAGTDWPGNSSVSIATKSITAALVVVPVGRDGHISVRNGAGRTDAMVDIVGYHPLSGGSLFTSIASRRLIDTRVTDDRFGAGETRTVAIGGLPRGATGVIVNVTSVDAVSGYLTATAGGSGRGGTSTLNMITGRTVTNRAYVAVGPGGTIDIHTSKASDVLVDAVGWFGSTGARFVPMTPARGFDSRHGIGDLVEFTGGVPQELDLRAVGVPAGATSVVMTLTAVDFTTGTFVTAWGHARRPPPTSDLNPVPGITVSNLIVAPLGFGSVDVLIGAGQGDIIGDVVGYFG